MLVDHFFIDKIVQVWHKEWKLLLHGWAWMNAFCEELRGASRYTYLSPKICTTLFICIQLGRTIPSLYVHFVSQIFYECPFVLSTYTIVGMPIKCFMLKWLIMYPDDATTLVIVIKLWEKKVNSSQHQGFSNWRMCSLHRWSFYVIKLLMYFVEHFYTAFF